MEEQMDQGNTVVEWRIYLRLALLRWKWAVGMVVFLLHRYRQTVGGKVGFNQECGLNPQVWWSEWKAKGVEDRYTVRVKLGEEGSVDIIGLRVEVEGSVNWGAPGHEELMALECWRELGKEVVVEIEIVEDFSNNGGTGNKAKE